MIEHTCYKRVENRFITFYHTYKIINTTTKIIRYEIVYAYN